MASVFTRHIADTLEREPKVSPPINLEQLQAGRLLNWILNFWDGDTISVRDICWRGPEVARKHKDAIALAETLVRQGWLTPAKSHRYDRKTWRIVREPNVPTVADCR
jgi:hypothetical protein